MPTSHAHTRTLYAHSNTHAHTAARSHTLARTLHRAELGTQPFEREEGRERRGGRRVVAGACVVAVVPLASVPTAALDGVGGARCHRRLR